MLVAGVGVWQRGGRDPGLLTHRPETGVVLLGRRRHSGNSRDLEPLTPRQCPFSSWTLLGEGAPLPLREPQGRGLCLGQGWGRKGDLHPGVRLTLGSFSLLTSS